MTFDQAKRRAIALADEAAKAAKGHAQRGRTKAAPLTVADVMATYLSYLDRRLPIYGEKARIFPGRARREESRARLI
ncbi:MAG: hypothetical protein WA733_08275 [Methylocystis sp.]